MKKMRFLALALAGMLALSGCGKGVDKGEVVMRVGDTKVTAGDMAVITDLMSGGDFDSAKAVIPEQVELSLKYGALGEAMKIELTADEKLAGVNTRAQQAKQLGGLSALEKYVKSNGSSIEFLDNLFGSTAYMSKVNEKITEMLAETPVSDEEVQKYYADNYMCAKHILIDKGEDAEASKKLAEEILERAKNGEDFDKMAQDYSTDPGLESNPQGYVFTSGEMVKPFEEGVKALEIGGFGICESDYGYHVLLRLDIPELTDEMKGNITKACENNRTTVKMDELLEEYGIKIEAKDDVINAITIDILKVKAEDLIPATEQ